MMVTEIIKLTFRIMKCSGKYVASIIKNLGGNSYSVSLNINDVTLDDATPEYSLHIAVADTKNINLPFTVDVEESVVVKVTEVIVETPIPIVETENPKEENGTIVAVGPKDVVVKQESISVFIIIGIIALCIIICILYYASRCCDKKTEEGEDIEKNTNVIEEPETKPLIKKQDKANLIVDVKVLNENLESKLESDKQKLSSEESDALEETLNNLREVINSPNAVKKEEEVKKEEVSEDQVDSVEAEDKPGVPKLKRVPTLPRDHPSHEDDKASIAKNARILRELTEELKKKEQEEKQKSSLVDVENNLIPVNEDQVPKKMLSRTSSIEIMRSKTVLLQNGDDEEKMMESTIMNIQTEPSKATFEAIELKIHVDASPSHPGGVSYTRMPEENQTDTSYSLSSSIESLREENQQLLSESETDSAKIVLAEVPVKTRQVKSPADEEPLVQKPPVAPRTSNPTSPTRTSTPDINGSTLSR